MNYMQVQLQIDKTEEDKFHTNQVLKISTELFKEIFNIETLKLINIITFYQKHFSLQLFV